MKENALLLHSKYLIYILVDIRHKSICLSNCCEKNVQLPITKINGYKIRMIEDDSESESEFGMFIFSGDSLSKHPA